jgi:outer membrane protein TolC
LLLGLLALATGCDTSYFRKSADDEVYRILEDKQKAALPTSMDLDIDATKPDPLAELPQRRQPLAGAEGTPGMVDEPKVLTLQKALEVALNNSRDFQGRKEDVYLAALDLTLQRHRWTPTFSGMLSGTVQRDGEDQLYLGDGQFGVSQMIATGAQASLSISTNFLRYMTGDANQSISSILSAQIVQPLWRGAGQRIAQENLRQSERDVVYAVRTFAQYNRTFVVEIASSYYGLLLARAVVTNEWQSYQRISRERAKSEMLAQAGRLPEYGLDQSRQEEFSTKDRWVRAVQQYRQRLDQFKIDLALAADAPVDVDESELYRLKQTGIVHPEIKSDDAVKQALSLRLDLINALDQRDDAQRKVDVAEDGLGPDVNLTVSTNTPTDPNQPASFRFDQGTHSLGLEVDPPFDRTQERNTYRKSLITLERAKRNATAKTDDVKQQVRQSWSRLQETRDSYEIQRMSLALAERRANSTSLLLEAGRADTRAMLDAQASLVQAQNALIGALVDHTIARLQLWRDIGTLSVTPQGTIKEPSRDGTEPSNP